MLPNTLSNRRRFRDRRSWKRIRLPAILIATGLGLYFAGLDLTSVRQWILDTGVWAPLVFVIAGVASLTLFVPKTAVSLMSGAMFGTFLGSLLMLFVAVMAAAINYAIGRWWLHDSLDRTIATAPRTRWLRAVREVASDSGFRFHFLLRLTPLPTAVISYAMGASGSRFRPFLLGAAAAVVPQALWVHGGSTVGAISESNTSTIRWFGLIVSLVAATTLTILIPRLAVKRMETMAAFSMDGVND